MKYHIINDQDGNEFFEVEAPDLEMALLTALTELGWNISEISDKED